MRYSTNWSLVGGLIIEADSAAEAKTKLKAILAGVWSTSATEAENGSKMEFTLHDIRAELSPGVFGESEPWS